MRSCFVVFALALSVTAVSCSKAEEAAKPASPTTAAPAPATAAPAPATQAAALTPVAEAEGKFNTLCATCHGQNGTGDGPGAAALNPKPRAYSDQEWQASVTDEHLKTIIVKGGPAVGKSPLMPPSPDLETKPEVVAELVKKIRSYKK